MSEVIQEVRNKTDSNVPVTSEAGQRRRSRHASVGSCVGVSCLALRHAALLCTVLPRITSTIDPNALDAEPIKRPLVRLRHPPPIPHHPRAFYCGPNGIFPSRPRQTHLRSPNVHEKIGNMRCSNLLRLWRMEKIIDILKK